MRTHYFSSSDMVCVILHPQVFARSPILEEFHYACIVAIWEEMDKLGCLYLVVG